MRADETPTIDEAGYPVDPETGESLPIIVNRSINRHALWAAGASMIPIPMIEVVTNTTMQIHMIAQLCDHYGVKFSDQAVKAAIGTFVGVVVPVGGIGTSAYLATRSVPVLGPVLGFTTAPLLAGGMTWAIGRVFAWHFDRGGTMTDFNAESATARFRREFEAGKRFTRQFVRNPRADTAAASA